MSANESFIDDTFGDSFAQTPIAKSEWCFDNAYRGPRDGHWDVASSAGSYIDDGVSTVHDARVRSGVEHSTPLAAEGLAKKLLQATLEDKRAELAGKDREEESGSSYKRPAQSTASSINESKPFVVPPLRHQIGVSMGPALPAQTRQANTNPQDYSKAKPPAAASKSGSQKGASDIASVSRSTNQKVRILGKHGQRVDVELPKLYLQPKSTHEQPQSRGAKVATPPKDAKKGGQHGDQTAKHPEAKQKPSSVKESLKSQPSRHSGYSKKDVIMSGGLPKSSHSQPVIHQAAPSSWKDSGVAMSGRSNGASRAGSGFSPSVLSVANSIAKMPSVQPQEFEEIGIGVTTGFPAKEKISRKSSVGKAVQSPSSQQTVRSKASAPVSLNQKQEKEGSRSNYRPPTVQSASDSPSMLHSFPGFLQQETPAEGEMQPDHLQPRERSLRSSRAPNKPDTVLQQHSQSASPNSNPKGTTSSTKRPGSKTPSHRSDQVPPDSDPFRYRSESSRKVESWTHSRAASPDPTTPAPKQTNFAGTGWISPHPLSVASSEANAPPQPAVWVSTDDVGQKQKLTHEEWQLQRSEARSASGSFHGSRVPSVAGLHDIPPAAYNHPPPAGYVGSYREVTGKSRQPPSQAKEAQSSRVQQNPWEAVGGSVDQSHSSRRMQSSTRSEARSARTAQQSVGQFSQSADWKSPPHYDGSGSPTGSTYGAAFGLTPAALERYQQQLDDTISHWSSQLSQVQQSQASQQPDYSAWNASQSHASRRESSRRSASSRTQEGLRSSHLSSSLADSWDSSSSGTGSTVAHLGQLVPQTYVSYPTGSLRMSTGSSGALNPSLGDSLGPTDANSIANSGGKLNGSQSAGESQSRMSYGAGPW